jgi:hypothetical protein
MSWKKIPAVSWKFLPLYELEKFASCELEIYAIM